MVCRSVITKVDPNTLPDVLDLTWRCSTGMQHTHGVLVDDLRIWENKPRVDEVTSFLRSEGAVSYTGVTLVAT